jgi:hypothetical protein
MHVAVRKPRRNLLLLAIALLLVAALWAAAAPPAATAAPPSNTWDLTALQTQLDSGSVQGYFLTVLGGATDADQAPVAIPATIESIVPGETQDGALILFSATGTTITDIGGIAAGMSGSPLYAGDPADPHPATDPLIGAVSYGDIFTTDGLGLATPIQYMIAVQTNNSAAKTAATPASHAESVQLAKPVTISAATVKRVVVAASAGKAKSIRAASDTAVFAPLDVIEIGGLSAQSRLFKQTASKLEAAGYQVEAAPAASAAGDYDPGWSQTLAAGDSVGTLYSIGDLWIGAAGTVTYVDGTTVMAYGHPLDWLGSTVGYLTNAWVSGIWHTTYEPYKLMVPAATQGTITQDRNSGVEGVVGTLPAATTVTSSATFDGGLPVDSTSQMPQAVVDGPAFSYLYGVNLPTYAAQVPIYKAIDAGLLGGSATTTTTVVVNDGTQDYTVAINNVWDDPGDVTYETTNDIDNILDTLTANADGIAPATIKSVDFSAALSAQRNETRIVAAEVPGGLKIGANDVTVELAQYGVAALQTAHVSLVLPRGTVLNNGIEVYGAGYGNSSSFGFGPMASGSKARLGATSDDRQSVADLVASLEAAPTNNDILVDYLGNSPSSSATLEGTGATTSFVNGDLTLNSDQMFLRALQSVVKRHASARLMGIIVNVDGPSTVSLYGTRVGTKTRKLLAVVPVTMTTDGMGVFSYTRKNLTSSTKFTAIWDGHDSDLGATATATVKVK